MLLLFSLILYLAFVVWSYIFLFYVYFESIVWVQSHPQNKVNCYNSRALNTKSGHSMLHYENYEFSFFVLDISLILD